MQLYDWIKNRLIIKNKLGLTMYKNNSRDCSKFKGCSPLQLSCNLTGKWLGIGYSFYTKRYQFSIAQKQIVTCIQR